MQISHIHLYLFLFHPNQAKIYYRPKAKEKKSYINKRTQKGVNRRNDIIYMHNMYNDRVPTPSVRVLTICDVEDRKRGSAHVGKRRKYKVCIKFYTAFIAYFIILQQNCKGVLKKLSQELEWVGLVGIWVSAGRKGLLKTLPLAYAKRCRRWRRHTISAFYAYPVIHIYSSYFCIVMWARERNFLSRWIFENCILQNMASKNVKERVVAYR